MLAALSVSGDPRTASAKKKFLCDEFLCLQFSTSSVRVLLVVWRMMVSELFGTVCKVISLTWIGDF